MKSLLKASAGIAALMMGAGMAVAQDTGTTGMQQTASDITCSDITALETNEAEQALYFVAGFQAGQSQSMDTAATMDSGAGASTDTTASADTGADTMSESGTDTTAAIEDSAGTGAEADMGSDTSASATDTEMGADTGTDTTASADTATGADTAAGTDTTTTAAIGGSLSEMLGTDIQVESIMTACEESPDRQVSQIIDEQRSGAGIGTGSDTGTDTAQ